VKAFLEMDAADRRVLCNQVSAELGLPERSVEKDFWVCWTLDRLFHLPKWGQLLTFKGGTSLSKGWKLIERFSEDIDIVIDRSALGFDGELAPERATSRKQASLRLDELRTAAKDAVANGIQPELQSDIEANLHSDPDWSLQPDPRDPDGQTLLFAYPSAYDAAATYVRPEVKIEMGARSDTDPTETITITPYVHDVYPEIVVDAAVEIRAVSPTRTFWEKAMLLHEEHQRTNAESQRQEYLARHFYDLYCLLKAGIGATAAADRNLFDRVLAHRQVFFRRGRVDYSTLVPGSLQLVPAEDFLPGWKSDYEKMQQEMFYGDVPTFTTIMTSVREFQDKFNETGRK